ncbi:MAG: alpha-2-macroglobulin family protein [Caulobacteraceae bacterium]|nr:alpha-2-macroglobulin family protein [Caulobacter sp.]
MAQAPRQLLGIAALVGAAVVAGFAAGYAARAPSHPASASGVAAGGVAWPQFGHPRPASAPRAAEHRPADFAVWTSRLDTSRGAPQACIRMSRALDPRRAYGDFVSVSPDLGHPAAVTASGDELCVAGVGYDGRTVTLLHGLPAADGETLADDAKVEVSGEIKPPFVGFASDGVILPREDADGVGLETVNVQRLGIEVWRVADRNLVRKSIETSEPTPEGGYAYDNDVESDGRKVWAGAVDVRATPDQRVTTVFPLGAVLKTLEPGAYVVEAKDASNGRAKPKPGEAEPPTPAQARRWILFTDMALQAYDGSDALDVTVRSLKTARAMAGVRVALVGKDGGDLASVVSDAAGHVRFARALLAGEAGAAPRSVMAYGPRGDFTTLDLTRAPVDLSSQDVGGRTPPGAGPKTGKDASDAASLLDGFLYADRGIYRPGETAHVTALVRDRLGRAVTDRAGALVIRRPSGLEYGRIRFDRALNGAVVDDLVLPATAPRGSWTAVLQMDGSDQPSGQATFQVEDFAPQRLAVSVAADAGRPLAAGETRPVRIDARFLYGAAAAGLPVQVETRIRQDDDPFPAFKGYAWGDSQHPFDEKLVSAPDTVTDGAGHALSALAAGAAGDTVQPLAATLTASVFEPGGRPVSEVARLKIRPKPMYLGVKATAGAGETPMQTFEVIAVDPSGRRIAAPQVNYVLVAETWTYDWFEENGRWSWRRASRDRPVAKGVLAVGARAPARISRRLPWGDYRLELQDPATGARTVLRQASGWNAPADGTEAPDAARLSPVKADYKVGDTVEVRIQAPFAGEAQVAVARDRLIKLTSLSVPKGGAVVRLHADRDWGGGAYVLVSVVQPRDPVASPKPRRALGVLYVPLKTPGRVLSVAFAAPPKVDSRQPLSVPLTVRGLSLGRRAHVTVAAVDEGILRLTHQKTPDPAAWYFGKRALGLEYRDDYGRLLDPNLGAAAAIRSGGDEMGGGEALTATPIKTVALWSGVVDTDAGGHATVRLPASPDFNGQLRLAAVAWTDEAVGSGASDVIVREPVVVELSPPRFLAPGDRASAAVEVHDVEGRAGRFVAELFGRGGVLAPFRQLLDLVLGQRVVMHADITAPDRPKIGRIDLHVAGPGYDTTRSFPLQTRYGWGPVTRATVELQRMGESYTPTPALLAGLSPGGVSMTVSYSPFRGFDPAPIAESLSRYPYGCSEQLVSTAAPILYGERVDPARTGAALAPAVGQLADRESLDGSFGLWRVADGEADGWLGAYIVDFLLEAQARGAPVPPDALARALSAVRLLSRPEGFDALGYKTSVSPEPYGPNPAQAKLLTDQLRSRTAAYALYDLAKAHRGDLPRLRWFHDVGFKTEPSALARAQVGAGLAAMGDRGRAHDSFVQAVRALDYKAFDDTYQSPLRDLAGVIALAYEAGEPGIARSLQGRLENSVRDPDALNTQEQAFLLRAAHAMLAASGPVRITASGVRPLGGAQWAVERLAEARFVNAGGPIWRTVTVQGLPLAAPAAGGVYLDVDKRLFTTGGAPVDPGAVRQGARIVVRLTGKAAAQRARMTVIDDALPAGFEIESVLKPEDAQPAVAAKPGREARAAGAFAFLGPLTEAQVEEKRDDRFIAAVTLEGGKRFALAYIARAVTPGDFFLPGAEARDMYRPQVQAHSAAGRLRIAAQP